MSNGPVLIDSMETMRRIVEAVRYTEHLRRTAIPLSLDVVLPPGNLVPVTVTIADSTISPYGFFWGKVQRLNTYHNTGWYDEQPSPITVAVRDIEGRRLFAGNRLNGMIVGELLSKAGDEFGEFENYAAVVVQKNYINPACGLGYNENDDTYYVDPNDFMVDNCFVIDNSDPYCPVVSLNYSCLATAITPSIVIDCGLEIVDGAIRVKPADVAGDKVWSGLVPQPAAGDCAVGVDFEVASQEFWRRDVITFFGRIPGGKIKLCWTAYVDADNYNAAGDYIGHDIGDGANICREVDVCDPACCTDCTITASIDTPADGVVVAAGDTVNFTSSASGCSGTYTYYWDFGDGTFGSVQNPSHVYSKAGTYEVKLQVMDDCGFSTDELLITVYVMGGTGCTLTCAQVTVTAATYPCGGTITGLPETMITGPLTNSVELTHGSGAGPSDPGMGFGVILQCNSDGSFNILPYKPPYSGGAYYSGPPPMFNVPGPLPITVHYNQNEPNCVDDGAAVTLLFEECP